MPEQDNLEFRKKTYKNLKTAFGDDYTLTEEQFNKNMDSDTAFVTKTYKNLKTAFGDDYSIVEEDFKKKVLPISGSPTTSASSNGSNPTQPTSGSGVSQSPAYSVKVDEGPMRKGQPSTVTVGGKEFEVAPTPELTSTEVKSTANKLFKIASPITSAAPKIPQSPVMDGVVKPTDEAAISNLSPKAASGNEDVLTEYISTLNEADQNRLRGSKMNDEQSFEILTKAYAPRLEQAVIDLSILRDRGVENDLKAIDDSQKQMQTLTQTISADKTALVDLQATFLKQKGYDKISSEYKSINKQLQVKQTELAPLFKEQQQLETTLKQFESLIQDGNFVGNEQEYNAYQETYKAYEQLTQSPELANYNNLVKKQNEISSSINSMVTPEYKAQEEKLLGRINTTVASANTLMQNSQGLLTPEKIENIELYKQTVEEYNSITNKLQTAKSKMPDVIEKEAYINAMNAAVKDNPYLKAFDLSAKAIGGFTEAVGSLLSAVPSFTGGMSNEYTFSDKVSESITNFFAPSITNTQTTTAGRPSAAYQPFYDSEIDHINWSSLPDEIANQAGAFAVLAGSGVLGGMAKFSEISSVVVPGALISYNDAYKTGREIYGDDAFSATAYATASSLITGITELIMPDRDILTGGSVDKIAKNYVVNYAKKGKRFAIERSLLDLTEMMGKEVTEEFADRWKDVLLKGVVNMTGGDIDNDIPTLNEQLSIAASTAALTGGVGAFSQRGKNSKARQLAVYQSAKSYPETITMLNTMEQEGYDADRIDAIKSEVTNMFVTLKEVPADLSAPKRIAIAEKLNTIKKIEDAMASGISPFIADRMNDSIKKISDDIQNIITDPNYDEVFGKEVNEDVAKSEDVTVTGMPVVEITPTTEEMMVEEVEKPTVTEGKDVPKKEESGIAELNAAGKELFFEKPIRKEYEDGVDGDNKYAQDNITHNEKVDNLILSINQNGTLIDNSGIEYDVQITSQGVRVSPKTQNDLKVYARGKRVSGSTPFTAGFKFIPATTTTTTTETVTPVAEETVITEPAQSEQKNPAITNTRKVDNVEEYIEPKEEDIKSGNTFELIRGNVYDSKGGVGQNKNIQGIGLGDAMPSIFGDDLMERSIKESENIIAKSIKRLKVVELEIDRLSNKENRTTKEYQEFERLFKERISLKSDLKNQTKRVSDYNKEKAANDKIESQNKDLGLVWLTSQKETAKFYAEQLSKMPKSIIGERGDPKVNYDIVKVAPKKIFDLTKLTDEIGGLYEGSAKTEEIEDLLGIKLESLPDNPEFAFQLFRGKNAKIVVDILKGKGYDVVRLKEGNQDNFVLINNNTPAKSEAVKEDTTTNTTTDEKGNEKGGQKGLLNPPANVTEDAAPIPEAPPLTPTETVVKETTPSAPKIFVSKKGNSIEKDAEGKVIVRDKKGKELSGRERSLAIGEFVREKIASKAGRISDKQLEEDNVTEQNIAQYISENSKNAGQILEAIANLRPDETAVERDRIIEEAMTGISEESFNRHSDRNLMTDTIRKNYIRKEGRDIDEIAQSASYAMFPDGDGTEISVEDVVEFIHNYPSGYKGKSFDPNKKALYDAFEQLTGVRPTPAMVRSLSSKKQMENDEDFAGLEPVETEGATVTVEGKEKEASFPKRVIADKKTSGQTKAKIDSARTYLEQKNIMSIGEATATIREIGAEAAEALVRDPLSEINGGVRGVMTQMLINYYDQNGEYEKSADLIRWAKQRLVDQGQEIQSYSLWNALRVGYTIQDSEIEYEKATGRKLPEYLRDRFEKIGEQVAKYEKRIAELEAIQKDKALDEAVGNIKDSIDRENKKPSTRKKNELSAEKKSRKAALRAKFGGIFNDFTNIPRLLLDKEFIEYNKLILEEAAGDFRNFVRLIVDGLGKKARPYAREFYKAAGGTELPDLEKAFVDDNGALKIPNEIIREIVAAGVTSADDLTEKVKEAIIKDVPDVTDREVKEAITQYGKTVNPSKDELDAEIRKLKRDGRLELGLDDAKEGKGVKRTGLQRDKPTDYQRELQRKINEELKKYPQDQQSVEKKWASALDRTKTHLKNTIADLNKRISDIKEGIAEPLPSKKRGFELDEEAKQLQEERDELKKILAELEPKQEMSDEARVKVALAAAERAITATADKINAQEFEYKKKKEPLNTPELVAARERLKLGKDVLNRMREESGFAEQHRYDLWKKRIQKRISDLQEKIDNKDFSVAPKKVMEINQEILELRVKADKLKFERDVEIEKARINSLTGLQKLKQIALDVINLPKSLMASADLSAPLRQGALLTARHPVMGLAAAKEMMKQAFSQKAQDKWVAALHESEIYPYMKHAKLFLSEPSVDLTAKEEQYISNIAEKIPVWGRVVKGSGRAYNGYLNKLRADVFSQFFYALKQEGVTGAELETQLKSYAKFINNATGRGDLGIGETSALVLNSAFFSPRYVASRFNLLNPVFYAKLEPRTRMEALKTMGTYVGVVSMTLALLSAMGDDDDDFTVELDPRSSDFAKLKWGDTRFDLLAGFQQWVRMFAQIVTGQKKSTTTGEVVTLGEGYKSDTRLDVLRKFFISKAAPAAAAGMNILRGKDMMGEPITPEGELLKLAIPLYVSDMYEVYKEEGIGKSVATTLPAFFGVGVQTYGKDKKQPTTREEVQEEMNRRLEKKAEAEMKKEARDNNPKIQKQKDKKEADEDALYERAKKYGIEYIEK